MIITVTLNAAMDKTLEVPSFTPGRRHRTVDQTTMPGGKGVNIARAIKRLGQPVIATGFAGGPTGSRIVEALNDESILNDFVRIQTSRAPTPPCSTRPPACRPRSTSGARGCRPRKARAVPREAPLPRPGREHLCLRRQPAARDRARHLLLADPRGAPARRHHDDRHRRRAAAAVDAGRARHRLAQRARGRGARRPRVQRRRRPRPGRGGDDSAGCPRGDHDGVGRVLRAHLRGRVSGACTGSGSPSRKPARRWAPATRSWPATSARATASASRPSACASASPAGPSRRCTSAPGSSMRRGSTACSARSRRADRDRRRDRLRCSAGPARPSLTARKRLRNLRLIAPPPRREGVYPLLGSASRARLPPPR